MTTPDPTCNSEGIHWDSNGKREIPCEVCDGTGEAGVGWSFNADTRDIEFGNSPVFKVYEADDFPCLEDDEREEADDWYDAQAQTAVLMLNSLLNDASDNTPVPMPALNPPTESVKAPEGVTQADREAAAGLWSGIWPHRGGEAAAMLGGKADDGPVVQAFMRHRLAASPTPITADDAVAKAIVALESALACTPTIWAGEDGFEEPVIRYDCGDPFEQIEEALAAIRSLSPDTEGEGM